MHVNFTIYIYLKILRFWSLKEYKRKNIQKPEEIIYILYVLKPCAISTVNLVNQDFFFLMCVVVFFFLTSAIVILSTFLLLFCRVAQFTCNLVKKNLYKCTLFTLLQEKPPARVSFTSAFEEQRAVELLLWLQHVFSPR